MPGCEIKLRCWELCECLLKTRKNIRLSSRYNYTASKLLLKLRRETVTSSVKVSLILLTVSSIHFDTIFLKKQMLFFVAMFKNYREKEIEKTSLGTIDMKNVLLFSAFIKFLSQAKVTESKR